MLSVHLPSLNFILLLRPKQIYMYRKKILCWLIGIVSFLPLPAQPKYEIRASWVTTLGGMDWPRQKANSPEGIRRQKEELCQLLDQLQKTNINTVLFQTRLRGDVIYPSVYEPFAESITGFTGKAPDYDPLAFAVEECHKRGMEIHAWFVSIPIGNDRQARLHGKDAVARKRPSICKHINRSWYLDPGNPETAQYLAGIVREIVTNYDIDGIHFDYIRYPDQAMKFPDQDTYRKYGNKQPIKDWRRDNITRIVRTCYQTVKSLKPWVKVSSSPIGKYNDTQRYTSKGWNAYAIVCQDAQRWLKEGIHDALFPMMYFQGNNFYPFALDWLENKNRRWVVPGLGIYFLHPDEQDWKLDEIVRQLYFIRDVKLDGQAYFRNRFLLDNTKGLLDELKERFYLYPAVVPAMTWQDSIPPAVPSHPSFHIDGKSLHLGWSASEDNDKRTYVTYRIYASNQYPVDIQKAENLMANGVRATEYLFQPEVPWHQRAYWAVTAVDRYGNESLALELNRPQLVDFQLINDKLPEIPEGCTLIVSDATGQEVLRTTQPTPDWKSSLKKGFYRLTLLHPDGSSELIGTLVQ